MMFSTCLRSFAVCLFLVTGLARAGELPFDKAAFDAGAQRRAVVDRQRLIVQFVGEQIGRAHV